VKLNHEAQEFKWVAPAETKKLKLNKPTKILISAVVKNTKMESGKRKVKKVSRKV